MVEVVAIVVSWNSRRFVGALLERLSFYKDFLDVVLVDNASADGTVEFVRQNFPYVKIILNEVNLGGSGGFNRGIEFALGKGYSYLWLLDSDAFPLNGALEGLLSVIKKDKTIGIVGSCILNTENTYIVNELGGFIRENKAIVEGNLSGSKLDDCHGTYEVDYVASCSAVIRTEVIKDIGLFDEDYFIYYDDIDFCRRAKDKGWRVLATANSKVLHPNFQEKGYTSLAAAYYHPRNSLFFFNKYFSKKTVLKGLVREARIIATHKLIGNPKLGELREKGVMDFLYGKRGEEKLNIVKAANKESKELKREQIPSLLFSYEVPYSEALVVKENFRRKHKTGKFGILLRGKRPLYQEDREFEKISFISLKRINSFEYIYSVDGFTPLSVIKRKILFRKGDKYYVSKVGIFHSLKLFLLPIFFLYKIFKYLLIYTLK